MPIELVQIFCRNPILFVNSSADLHTCGASHSIASTVGSSGTRCRMLVQKTLRAALSLPLHCLRHVEATAITSFLSGYAGLLCHFKSRRCQNTRHIPRDLTKVALAIGDHASHWPGPARQVGSQRSQCSDPLCGMQDLRTFGYVPAVDGVA
jgi:hypothetical protein